VDDAREIAGVAVGPRGAATGPAAAGTGGGVVAAGGEDGRGEGEGEEGGGRARHHDPTSWRCRPAWSSLRPLAHGVGGPNLARMKIDIGIDAGKRQEIAGGLSR